MHKRAIFRSFVGIILSIATSVCYSAESDALPINLGMVTQILETPLAAKELQLSEEQRAEIVRIHHDYQQMQNRAFVRHVAAERNGPISPEQHQAESDELTDAHDKTYRRYTLLLSSEQRSRLSEIFNQWLGPYVFSEPPYFDAFRLSPAQLARTRWVIRQYGRIIHDAESAFISETPRVIDDVFLQQQSVFRGHEQQWADEAMRVISEDLDVSQRATWEKFFGRPIDVLALRRQLDE